MSVLTALRRVYLAESEAAYRHKFEEASRKLDEFLNSTNTIDGKRVAEIIDDILGVVKPPDEIDDTRSEESILVDSFPRATISPVSTELDS